MVEALKLVVGKPMSSKVLTWNLTLLKKVWHWMLEQTGGLQCLWHRVGIPPAVEEKDRTWTKVLISLKRPLR